MASSGTAEPNYGHWVSKKIIYIPLLLGLVILPTSYLLWPSALVSILLFSLAGYFAYARYLFSPNGSKVQSHIWDNVVSKLQWNGQGRALDIGCGNGALSIKVAKKYPQATVTGIDYWGSKWEFSKSACEANAKAEGVAERVEFQKASASKLPFEDGYFDAVVSNLCFHEVADTKDKRELLREAFRVLKAGGRFAFQDLFLLKQYYGEPEELVATIKSWGVNEVEFIETRNEPFIPSALKLPFMVGRIAIIKGEK
jgi:SAM-dependent methyltransferase